MMPLALEPISNRADWFGAFELINDDTGEVITDLTGVTVKLAVRPKGHGHCYPSLTGTTEDGIISIIGEGVIEWHFPASRMACVCAGTYDIGITVTRDDLTDQELIASLPVIDGVVGS
jgi:hypothetical protein